MNESSSDPLGHGVLPPSSRLRLWWPFAAVIALCLVVGLPTVRSDNYFLGDDFGLVQHLHNLPAGRLATYFVSDWTEGIYGTRLDELRPLLAFTYWFDAHLVGAVDVKGYHATNVVLHALNALLVLGIARAIAPADPTFGVLAAALFALMPSHAEPVAWISGRVDSLAALFYLGSFLCFVRFRHTRRRAWLVSALLVFSLGLFAKQSLVTLPVAILVFDLLGGGVPEPLGQTWRARLRQHVPFFVLLALYLLLRWVLFTHALREDRLTLSLALEFVLRQGAYLRALLPAPEGAPPVVALAAGAAVLGVLATCARSMLSNPRSFPGAGRLLFFGGAWYLITVAPMVVTYLSARHLYITAAGVSIAMASVVLPGRPLAGYSRARLAAAGLLVVLYGLASMWNVSAWVASGVASHRLADTLPGLLRSVPHGTVVFLDVPQQDRHVWFWSWATPFALQPPFTQEDLYGRIDIVEPPPIYCCPPNHWWAAKKGVLLALMQSDSPTEVVSIRFATDSPGPHVLTRRMLDGRALRRRIEAAIGRSIDETVTTLTPEEAWAVHSALVQELDRS